MYVYIYVYVNIRMYETLMIQKKRNPFHLSTSLIAMYGVFVPYQVIEILLCLKLYLGVLLNVFYSYFPRFGYYTSVHHKQYVWVLWLLSVLESAKLISRIVL